MNVQSKYTGCICARHKNQFENRFSNFSYQKISRPARTLPSILKRKRLSMRGTHSITTFLQVKSSSLHQISLILFIYWKMVHRSRISLGVVQNILEKDRKVWKQFLTCPPIYLPTLGISHPHKHFLERVCSVTPTLGWAAGKDAPWSLTVY